jgi:hypothetical protein
VLDEIEAARGVQAAVRSFCAAGLCCRLVNTELFRWCYIEAFACIVKVNVGLKVCKVVWSDIDELNIQLMID